MVCTFADSGRIQRAEQRLRHQMRNKGFVARYDFENILTDDPAMLTLKSLAQTYAAANATVLIQGETGTGKELFAQGIHHASRRAEGPFVAINCAAIPESLLESELFGYEEGAFTGARRSGKAGMFELAHQGTLFLDEVGELPLPLQARLLRVLQEREVVRLGGTQVIPVDVRILCATHRDLDRSVAAGAFRQDLLYRLNVLSLNVPPLRERRGDITHLARYFLHQQLSDKRLTEQCSTPSTRYWNSTTGRETCASCKTSRSGWRCLSRCIRSRTGASGLASSGRRTLGARMTPRCRSLWKVNSDR